MENSSQFFCNKDCEYFPCHNIKKEQEDSFNCMFCYCPLNLYKDCGGQYTILPNGWKDCSKCLIPHFNYEHIINYLIKNGGNNNV